MKNSLPTLRIYKNDRELLRAGLSGDRLLIGRSPVCDVVLRAKNVAPIHFLLERQQLTLVDDAPSDLWLLFEIFDHGLTETPGDGPLGSAAGIVLSETPRAISGFEFSLASDSLSETHFPEAAFKLGVLKTAEQQDKFMRFQGAYINAVECLLYEKQSHSIDGLAHIPIGNRVRSGRPFAKLPQLTVRTARSEGPADQLATLAIAGPAPLRVRNRRLASTAEAAPQPMSQVPLKRTDFLELEFERHILFVRGIIHEPFDWKRKASLAHPLAFFLAGLFLFVLSAFNLVNAIHDEPLPAPRRVVRLTEAPRPVVAPPPAPAPARAETTQAAPEEKPATAPSWTTLVEKLKRGEPQKEIKINSRTGGAPQARSREANPMLPRTTSGLERKNSAAPDLTRIQAPNLPARMGKGGGSSGATDVGGNGDRLAIVSAKPGFGPSDGGNTSGPSPSELSGGAGSGMGVTGGLERSQVQATINGIRNDIRVCFERQLITEPNLKGRLVFDWLVDPKGTVQKLQVVESSLPSKAVESCMRSVLMKLQFPKSASGVATQVRYPFFFAPF